MHKHRQILLNNSRCRIPLFESLDQRALLSVVPFLELESVIELEFDRPKSVEFTQISDTPELLIQTHHDVHFVRFESDSLTKRVTISDAQDPKVSDQNADDYPDLVALRNEWPFVWLNDGRGDFGPPTRVVLPNRLVGDRILQIDVADVDSDGDDDLHIVGFASQPKKYTVGWLINSSEPAQVAQFTHYVEVIAFEDRAAVNRVTSVIGDFDGDSDVDVVTHQAGEILFFRNESLGFHQHQVTEHGEIRLLSPIEAHDTDGNGEALIVPTRGLRGQANRTQIYSFDVTSETLIAREEFDRPSAGATAIAFGDIDGDGDKDAIRATPGIAWFRNNGNSFEYVNQIAGASVLSSDLAIGDYDQDGDLDVVTVDASSDTVSWYENSQDGAEFTEHVLSRQAVSGLLGVKIADINRDGIDDFVAYGDSLTYLQGMSEPGRFAPPAVVLELSIRDIAIADFDGDDDLDFAIADEVGTAWLENRGAASFIRHELGPVAEYIEAVDFDQDGDVDLFASDERESFRLAVTRFENAGENGGWMPGEHFADLDDFIPDTLEEFEDFFNFTGDFKILTDSNRPPMLVAQFHRFGRESVGAVGIQQSESGDIEGFVLAEQFGDDIYHSISIGDINRDGRDDIVTTYTDDRRFMAWYDVDTAARQSIEHVLNSLDHTRGMTDLDGDGDVDLLLDRGWGDNLDGQLTEYRSFQLPFQPSLASDVNRDGFMDVVTVSGNRLLWARNATGDVDFIQDDFIDHFDVDTLAAAIRDGSSDSRFDITGNATVDRDDLNTLLRDRLFTSQVDINLDGVFNSSDLVKLFQSGKYRTGTSATWSQGDWDLDGYFDTSDLVFAFQLGQYDTGIRDDD